MLESDWLRVVRIINANVTKHNNNGAWNKNDVELYQYLYFNMW